MNLKYDRVGDVLYLNLNKGKIMKTVELANNLVIDMGTKGKIIGVEILNFSQQYSKSVFTNFLRNGIPVEAISTTAKLV